MELFAISEVWYKSFPGAHAGILAMRNASNFAGGNAFIQSKSLLENRLRTQYAGYERDHLNAIPVIQAYNNYYKRFKKTYHVLLQLESVVFKGKSILSATPLVEVMFMAELKNLLLTAVHDLESIQYPVRLSVSNGSERYTLLRGEEQVLKAGDMFMEDGLGVISSIIYGPDQRTRIQTNTQQVLYTVYAPPGIERQKVSAHLEDMRDSVLLIAPEAELIQMSVYDA